MPRNRFSFLLTFVTIALISIASAPRALAYDKASELNEVVLNKLFPKKQKIELDGRFGLVLNSSYKQTFLANTGLTYFWSEEWGFNVEGNFAMTSDKAERGCIESFYNDPNYAVSEECGDGAALSEDTEGDANFGPAYVPIRELKYMFIGNFVWNPIYGKQIVLLSATNYFDFYIKMGGGIAMSDFYPKKAEFDDGTPTRKVEFCTKKDAASDTPCDPSTNPGTNDKSKTGTDGRPAPEAQTHMTLHLSIGQRFHFMKRFMVTASLENYTLLATDAGFDNFLALMGGVGVRF